MNNSSMLAAVHAAANEPVSAVADADLNSQTQEKPMAETQNVPAAAPAKITSLAEMRAAYPALCNEFETSASLAGATAERERLAGIELVGKNMPGHEALLDGLKADGKTTPEQAAMAVTVAEGKVRGAALAGVKSVEDKTGKVAAAPAADTGAAPQYAATPDGWKQEYEDTPKLRAEYPNADAYVATRRRDALKVVG